VSPRRIVAIVPAFNEAGAIGSVIDEIRAFDPSMDVVVIDDGSRDGTAAAAVSRGAAVVRLPYNLGIGGRRPASNTPEHGYELAVRSTETDSTKRQSSRSCSTPSNVARPTSSRAPGSSAGTATTARRSPGASASPGSRGS
jgi:hypothetical protein